MSVFVPTLSVSVSYPLFPGPSQAQNSQTRGPAVALLPPRSGACRAAGRCARAPVCWAARGAGQAGRASTRGLAEALGEDALGRHPQQHAALQVGQQAPQHVGAGRRLQEANLRDPRRQPQQSAPTAAVAALAASRRCSHSTRQLWLRAPARAMKSRACSQQSAGKGAGARRWRRRLPLIHTTGQRTQQSSAPPQEFLTFSPLSDNNSSSSGGGSM